MTRPPRRGKLVVKAEGGGPNPRLEKERHNSQRNQAEAGAIDEEDVGRLRSMMGRQPTGFGTRKKARKEAGRRRGDLHYGLLLLPRFHLRVEERHEIQTRDVGEGRRGRESERRRKTKPRTMSNIDWEAPTSFHTWRKRRKQLPIRRGRPRARSGRTTSGRRALEEPTLRLRGRKTRSLDERTTPEPLSSLLKDHERRRR